MLLGLALVLMWSPPVWAQDVAVPLSGAMMGTSVPAACAIGQQYLKTSDSTFYLCTAANTWKQFGWAGGSSLPSGIIVGIVSGTCPTGFSEVAALSGKMARGTVAANGNVGQSAGSDTYTPAGTISALTFTGMPFTDVINHTHAVNITDPGHAHGQQVRSTGTAGTAGTQGGSTANNVTVGTTATATTGISATTSNPAGGVSSITPAGTINTPTFTGTQATVLPAYVNVIWCQAN